MQEQQRTRLQQGPGDSAGGFFDNQDPTLAMATVSHGIYAADLPVAGLTAGEVRRRFQDRFDIHPRATALIDGHPVDANTRIRSGQLLSFVRPSGEKGAIPSLRRRARGHSGASVTLQGQEARALLPEGDAARVPIGELTAELGPSQPDTGELVLPEGVKCVLPTPTGFVVVHQTPPRVYNLRWLAEGSPAEYGPGTKYRKVRVAFPYLIVLAVFGRSRRGIPRLGGRNECFFLNQGLEADGLDSELRYPALLNCSRFPDRTQNPLSWICTQNLRPGPPPTTLDQSLRQGLRALLHHLLETGFNRSSENHELSSWFSETVEAGVDPRLGSVESWEEATARDPLFVLEVPWLETGHSLRKAVDRIVADRRAPKLRCADDVARLVFGMQGGR